jgi:hypothetical protein
MITVLFRQSLADEGEFEVCKKYFRTVEQRSKVLDLDDLAIGRYSVLPYYRELERDLPCRLINTHEQHCWIADFAYYEAVKDYTPETWYSSNFYQCEHPGPFVVKGTTNSRKLHWDEQMFAPTKRDAIQLTKTLYQDSYIGSQEIIFRKFVPLRVYETGMFGLPFSNEWRFFCYKQQVLSHGYYWSSASEETIKRAKITQEGFDLVNKLMPIVSKHVDFYVLDIAETAEGDWILIEINDGQMSGLSENNPDKMYRNLRDAVYFDLTT